MANFEFDLTGNFTVQNVGTAILTESPDSPADLFPAPGPFGPAPSNNLIQTDQPVHIHKRFRVTGALASVLCDFEWKLSIILEQIGCDTACPGPFEKIIDFVPSADHTYDTVIDIPANSLPKGVYKPVLCITLQNCKGVALPVVGFEELSMIKVYEAA
ncbi:MAG: hypothetical protein AAFN65_01130 [Bacteroidota bacterium]